MSNLKYGRPMFANQWIIFFKKDVVPESKLNFVLKILEVGKIPYIYEYVLNAIVVSDISRQILVSLLDDDDVLLIEQDQPVYATEIQTLEDDEPWGLDRIDESKLSALDGTYNYEWTGKGVDVFIFDTGIQSDHEEFGGRVSCGFNLFEDTEDCEDGKGHGTHVAGTVGGETYGVAKEVNLVTVKVLNEDGIGGTSGVIQGLDYVIGQKMAFPNKPMIINLSLGTSLSAALNEAVNKAVDAGLVVISAAGNDSVDACDESPGSAEKGITVGATNIQDKRPLWSNYGPCIDIFAPGSEILSADEDKKDKKGKATKSGTSTAAPHVAGVASLYLEWDPTLTPEQVSTHILNDAVKGEINTVNLNSTNLLVNTAEIQSYWTPQPTRSPNQPTTTSGLRPSSSPTTALDPPEYCGIFLISTCEEDIDCCSNLCHDFAFIFEGSLGKRCLFSFADFYD